LLKPQDLPQSILTELKVNLDEIQASSLKILDDRSARSKSSQIPTSTLDQESNTFKQEELFETFKDAKERWLTIFEKDYILATLKRSKYNISHAARDAQIDRKYFRTLMQKYGIEVPYSKEEIQEQSNESHESD
jgi:DNA-binding NtrC family response regulator